MVAPVAVSDTSNGAQGPNTLPWQKNGTSLVQNCFVCCIPFVCNNVYYPTLNRKKKVMIPRSPFACLSGSIACQPYCPNHSATATGTASSCTSIRSTRLKLSMFFSSGAMYWQGACKAGFYSRSILHVLPMACSTT